MQTTRRVRLAMTAAAVMAICACGAGIPADSAVCEGKCDGKLADKFVDLWRDPSRFEPGDLSKWTADLATKEINKLLAEVPFFTPRLSNTDIYALDERAERSFTIKSLRGLTAGLTQAYGETDFSTRINDLRRRHLEANPRHVWAEAHFALPSNPRLSFNVADIGLSFGFTNLQRDVDATIIAPFNADSAGDLGQALVDAPARAVMTALGGLPNNLDDFYRMQPGQMVALHSTEGVAGFTFNASTPVYLASISEATLWARISAAAHVIATGELDVQMLRDDGSQLVVDVGITEQGDQQEPNMHFRLAADGYWGFDAFSGRSVKVGPVELDWASLANRTVRNTLNKSFQPFKAAIEWNPQVKTRHTVVRLGFDLSPNMPAAKRAALEQALALASRGVLWYAQLLADKPGSGVTRLLGVDRLARRPSFYVGLQLPIFGMSFHYQKKTNVGNATITIGRGTQQLFWNELEKNSGWFWTDKDYKVTGIASLKSEAGQPIDTDYNLRLTLVEKQGNALRDEILDQVDPLLSLFVGADGLEQLAAHTDAIERFVSTNSCPALFEEAGNNNRPEWERCMLTLPQQPAVASYSQAARSALEEMIQHGRVSGQLHGDYTQSADFARQLLALKIAAQGLPEDPLHLTRPESTIRVQARLTARAIDAILATPGARERFGMRLAETVSQVNVERTFPRGPNCWQADSGQTVCRDNPANFSKEIAQVVAEFDRQVVKYQQLTALAALSFRERDTGRQVVMGDHGIVIEIDRQGRLIEDPTDEARTFAAMAERKAASLREFFEKMVAEAEPGVPLIGRLFGDGLGHTEHQVLGYTLMKLTGPSEMELLIQADFDGEPRLDGNKVVDLPELRLYGRGAEAKLIDAGTFGLESLIDR